MTGKIPLCGFERDENQRGGAWETQLGAMADGVRLPGPFISFVFTASQCSCQLGIYNTLNPRVENEKREELRTRDGDAA
ncbi:hypothetical protein CapIbe_000650 [Capra ibex]